MMTSSRSTKNSPPKLAESDRARAERARRRFPLFVREAWPIVSPTPLIETLATDAIAEHLQAVTRGQIRDLLINVPPRFAKSTLVSVLWPVWEWIDNPALRILGSSYALKLAIRDAVASRRLIRSEWFQLRWGHKLQLSTDQDAKGRYDTTAGGFRIATSVDGSATGDGGDRILVDDPHSAKGAQSDAERETAIEWWTQTMSTRANDPKTVRRVIVMQRLHERDLSGHVIAEGGFEHLRLPMRFNPKARCRTSIGWVDPRTEEGELLAPERFDEAATRKLEKGLGSYGTAGQLDQQPTPAGGGILKRADFRRYSELPAQLDRIVLSVDAAFKGKESSDPVALQAWGAVGAFRYLISSRAERMGFGATKQAIRDLYNRIAGEFGRIDAVYIEDKANGPAIVDELVGFIPGLIAVDPQGGKLARAFACQPQIEAGQVFIPENAEWVEGFLGEAASFPLGAHDDQIDAMTQALIRLSEPEFVIV